MASGIFAILDDIAALLDDAAVMSKVAAKKTAGLLGDDLAVNAEKATGFQASRELPVIWAITKGSIINKLIILPVALLLSAYMPWLIVPILLLGGAYLSFEGVEKVYEWLTGHGGHEKTEEVDGSSEESSNPEELEQREKKKIKAAVRTDFILSIEIIVIALGTVVGQSLVLQIIVVSMIALIATVGVYGFVALIVRMDDTGYFLIRRSATKEGLRARVLKSGGEFLAASLPRVIRLLGIIGTVAMLLVGGGMFVHNIDAVHHALEILPAVAAELLTGMIVGSLLLVTIHLFKAVRAPAS
ncbi:MAG: DUF808 domain-containing protein [Thermodesulfobacteriota bacterium]